MIIEWEKLATAHIEENPPDFITHLNYLEFLKGLSNNIKISLGRNYESRFELDKTILQKKTLVDFTKNSLDGEKNQISQNIEYAAVCVSWVAIKCYYLLFHQQIILNYLINGQRSSLRCSHEDIINCFHELTSQKKIIFTKNIFNNTYSLGKVLGWKTLKYENIRFVNIDPTNRLKQVLKKISKYRLETFKQHNKIPDFKTKKNQILRNSYLQNELVSINDFFYEYRLKANYRDLSFLENNVGSQNVYRYFVAYYELTTNFYSAYKEVINKLSVLRGNNPIF